MAFEELMFIPKSDTELTRDVAREIQRKLLGCRNLFFFIKLEECENHTSRIIWTKVFPSYKDLEDFYFDTKFQRCCIMVDYKKDGYFQVCGFGFHFVSEFHVYPNEIIEIRDYEITYKIEEERMPTREQLAQMLGQLQSAISKGQKTG